MLLFLTPNMAAVTSRANQQLAAVLGIELNIITPGLGWYTIYQVNSKS